MSCKPVTTLNSGEITTLNYTKRNKALTLRVSGNEFLKTKNPKAAAWEPVFVFFFFFFWKTKKYFFVLLSSWKASQKFRTMAPMIATQQLFYFDQILYSMRRRYFVVAQGSKSTTKCHILPDKEALRKVVLWSYYWQLKSVNF